MGTLPIAAKTLERYYHVNGQQLERHYKGHLSRYRYWEQREYADKWLLFPENMGTHPSIDETSLSGGELYAILTDKASKGRKGAIIAIVEGTKAEDVMSVPDKLPEPLLDAVQEVTLDMPDSMRKIIRHCFPKASRVIDRFHVQRLAFDALQEMRISHRWDAINEDTDAKETAKLDKKEYIPLLFENGDTRKQLLARSYYLLFKSPDKWSEFQKRRAEILFREYPDLKEGYSLTHSLRMIYSKNSIKAAARLSLAKWYSKVAESQFKSFDTIAVTVYEHHEEILRFLYKQKCQCFGRKLQCKN